MFERLGEICANKEVYLTDLDHDEVTQTFVLFVVDIFTIFVIRFRLCSGGSLTKTITSPRPPQTRAWRRSWREYQTLWRYYPHLLISGWVFIDPQFPIFLITPRQYIITIHSILLRLLSPNCIVMFLLESPKGKDLKNMFHLYIFVHFPLSIYIFNLCNYPPLAFCNLFLAISC